MLGMKTSPDAFYGQHMSRRPATAEQLVWRSLVGLLLVVVLWLVLATMLGVL
jgi:hypothetical protein